MKSLSTTTRLPITPSRLSELILLMYGTARKPANVNEFLRKTCWHVDAVAGSLSTVDVHSGHFRYIDFHPHSTERASTYEERFSRSDPIKRAILKAEPLRFIPVTELLPSEVLDTDPFFSEWLGGLGLHDVVTARIPVSEQYNCLLGFLRASGQPRFSEVEVNFLNLLVPHVEQAILMHGYLDRLGVLADLAQEHFLQAGYGLTVLNEDGFVLLSNRFARRLIESGTAVTLQDGKLRLGDARADERFNELVRQCVAVSDSKTILAGGSLSVPRNSGAPLAVTVMPFRRQAGFQTVVVSGSRAVVMFYDPDRPRVDNRAVLRNMYRLSEAEAEVCWRIGVGETVDEIVAATGASRETVRSQVKRVFAKTGVNRQADLVRLVLLGPAIWGRQV